MKLPADETVIVHMLGDPRWFVVRNAAELAGDLRLRGTEGALMDALVHDEPRVRRAAAAALGRLASPAAMDGSTVTFQSVLELLPFLESHQTGDGVLGSGRVGNPVGLPITDELDAMLQLPKERVPLG